MTLKGARIFAFLFNLYIIVGVGFLNLFLAKQAAPDAHFLHWCVLCANIPLMGFIWSRLPSK